MPTVFMRKNDDNCKQLRIWRMEYPWVPCGQQAKRSCEVNCDDVELGWRAAK